jgi:hypothetical protein
LRPAGSTRAQTSGCVQPMHWSLCVYRWRASLPSIARVLLFLTSLLCRWRRWSRWNVLLSTWTTNGGTSPNTKWRGRCCWPLNAAAAMVPAAAAAVHRQRQARRGRRCPRRWAVRSGLFGGIAADDRQVKSSSVTREVCDSDHGMQAQRAVRAPMMYMEAIPCYMCGCRGVLEHRTGVQEQDWRLIRSTLEAFCRWLFCCIVRLSAAAHGCSSDVLLRSGARRMSYRLQPCCRTTMVARGGSRVRLL